MGFEAFIPITLFLSVAAVFILRGPLGKALADRIGGRAPDAREVRELRGEVDELRQQLGEVQERLDFAERLLAQQREHALPKGKG
jgi:hypothetical protein